MRDRLFSLAWMVLALTTTVLADTPDNRKKQDDAPKETFEYTAQGFVELRADRRLRWTVPKGRVRAPDMSTARQLADAEIETFLKINYPGWKEVRDLREWRISPVRNSEFGDSHTEVKLTFSCLTMIRQEKGVFKLLFWDLVTQDVVTDTFDYRLIVTHKGRERRFEGKIRTLGRGDAGQQFISHTIWDGDFLSEDGTREFNVQLLHTLPPDPNTPIPPPGTLPAKLEPRYVEAGSFVAKLQHVDGKMVVDWKCGEGAKFGKGDAGAMGTFLRLQTPKSCQFHVTAIAMKEKDLNDAYTKSLEEAEKRNEEMKHKLAKAGAGIQVFEGGVAATIRGGDGKPQTVSMGSLVVISPDLKAAKDYASKQFPKRPTLFALTKAQAEEMLKDELLRHHSHPVVIGDNIKVNISPKTQRTVGDDISELNIPPKNPPPIKKP